MNLNEIKILVVDDDEIVRESLNGWFKEDGYNVETARDAIEALNKINTSKRDIYFLDIKMPGMDGLELQRKIREIDPEAIVIIITAYAAVDSAVQALKEGAYDYVTKPFDPDQLSHIVSNALKQKKLSLENESLKTKFDHLAEEVEIIGESDHIKEVKESIRTVSNTNTTVMIRGESGTGKELVAQSIHLHSNRKYCPIVSVNCGAFSETLLESELFGHEKGAFTGAAFRRKGKLEIADGGSLFLDEVGAIHPKTQVELLRAIETKEFTRLGSNKSIKSDFRIICATNLDLEEAVKGKKFREDLYYRLKVFVIELKPLRERIEDIVPLANHFLEKYSREMSKQVFEIESSAIKILKNYSWPGNVRELENAIERALVVTKSNILKADDLCLSPGNNCLEINNYSSLEEIEKTHIAKIVDENSWNISKASKILGIDRATLYAKLKKYGIDRPGNGKS